MIAVFCLVRRTEESPGSRKQGVPRKRERETASRSHRNYVGPSTLKV